jgi:hypothetical protein
MRQISSFVKVAALLCLVVCAGLRVAATTLVRLSLEQLAQAAGTVARVRCTGTESYLETGTAWTRTQFSVIEPLKGAPPPQITVRLPGGRVGQITVFVEAVPRFQPGDEGILFLETTRTGDYSVAAWAEGTFRIWRNARTGEEAVTQDSSALAVFDPAAWQFRVEGIRDLPLGEFRRRLATALAAGRGGR